MFTIFLNLKNHNCSFNNKIKLKNTKITIKILNLLIKEGLIYNYIIQRNVIFVYLKYFKNKPIINKLQIISKPSKKIYIKNKHLFSFKKDLFLISTVKGIMKISEAKKNNLGGKLICRICL